MRIIILTSIFLQVAMSGCQVPADQAELPSNFPETVFYQIYTRGFCDSDGDGIGDLNGITSKLDYLEDLGVGALWIMPLFSAPTVHKYFAGDFLTVDPEYGTADDLRNLVAEAHKHNIKVLIDFSINHVSYHHSWFQKSMQGDSSDKYREYFHWVRSKEDYNPENHTLDGVHDTAFDKNYKRAKAGSGAEDDWY